MQFPKDSLHDPLEIGLAKIFTILKSRIKQQHNFFKNNAKLQLVIIISFVWLGQTKEKNSFNLFVIMRINIFEFEDIKGFPNGLRNGMTDYLRFILTFLKIYDPVVPIINKVLYKSKLNRIVDMCSGGGGTIETIYEALARNNLDLEIILTDLYPNLSSFELIKSRTAGQISFRHQPVDAAKVPSELNGVRTMFSAFHHFSPKKAKEVLQDAIVQKSPIAIFDGGEKNLLMVIMLILFHPFFFLFFTPFIRPFKVSRIVFTYLLPLIPLFTIWDGIASILRLYNPEQMLAMANDVSGVSYKWDSGMVRGRNGIKVNYLVGWPME